MENPCLTCGACCAHFRASFHWSEADDAGGAVPVGLTVDVDPFRRAMLGTERGTPCCVALEGAIGSTVRCVIYEQRPSVCREFSVSWHDGSQNEKCDQARRAHGLAALVPPLPNSIEAPRDDDARGVDIRDPLSHNIAQLTRTRT